VRLIHRHLHENLVLAAYHRGIVSENIWVFHD
jgi:hypothetical protein